MGSTVTIKDMRTLEGQMGKMYTATCLAVSIDSKSKIIFQVIWHTKTKSIRPSQKVLTKSVATDDQHRS